MQVAPEADAGSRDRQSSARPDTSTWIGPGEAADCCNDLHHNAAAVQQLGRLTFPIRCANCSNCIEPINGIDAIQAPQPAQGWHWADATKSTLPPLAIVPVWRNADAGLLDAIYDSSASAWIRESARHPAAGAIRRDPEQTPGHGSPTAPGSPPEDYGQRRTAGCLEMLASTDRRQLTHELIKIDLTCVTTREHQHIKLNAPAWLMTNASVAGLWPDGATTTTVSCVTTHRATRSYQWAQRVGVTVDLLQVFG